MTLQIGLNLVTLIMCIITLTMATAALMPQIKQAVLILRDGLLWMALIVVVGGVAIVGWGRFFKIYAERHQQGAVSNENPAPLAPTAFRLPTSPAAEPARVTKATLSLRPEPPPAHRPQPAFSANRSRPLDDPPVVPQ